MVISRKLTSSFQIEYSNAELYAKPINNFIYEPDLKVTIETREQVYKNKPLLNFLKNRYVTKSGELSSVILDFYACSVCLVYAIAKKT
jgi:hypothetical protein